MTMCTPLLLAALTAGALCEEQTVIVVPSITGMSDANAPGLSRLIERCEAVVRKRACIRALPIEAAFAMGDDSAIDRCGADEACLSQALGNDGARFALISVLASIPCSASWRSRRAVRIPRA